ncbi:MAG: hypothetical protein IKA31_05160, partial [Clostridia bacterium]|nr:hypothetical protein [Clostridia bacterium]
MKDYKLREDEVVLYKGKVKLEDFDGDTKFILTNINFVFITQGNQENSTIIYPIHEVKIYEGVPQIKHKGN